MRNVEDLARIMNMTWSMRALLNAIPLGVLVGAACFTRVMLPRSENLALYGLGLLVFPAGRFVTLIPIVHPGLPFTPFFLAGLAVLTESCIAFFVMVNLDVLFKLPWLGQGLRGIEHNGRATLSRRRWIRRMAFLGVVIFVSIPVPGTGAVGGTVVGRLVGLGEKRTLLAVLTGTVVGAYGMALGASALAQVFRPERDSIWFGILRLGIIILIIVFLSLLGRRGVETQ
jgi:uncharacterized membrane protein